MLRAGLAPRKPRRVMVRDTLPEAVARLARFVAEIDRPSTLIGGVAVVRKR